MRKWRPTAGKPVVVVLGVFLACMALGAGADWLPLATPYKRNLAAGTLQLVLLTLTAGYLAAWWAGRASGTSIEVSPRVVWFAVAAGIVLYAAGLSYLSLVRHQALLTGIWDLGYYGQLTWELSNLEVPRSSVWRDTLWGNHATFILLVAAPFLWLVPDPATLLVFQSVVLALGAVPAFVLGRCVWGHPLAGAVFAGAYLLYPPLQFSNLFDFHADTFATPILLSAFAALFAGRVGWALVWASLLILVKEDMALVTLMFGLYVAVVHRRRSGLVLASVAAVSFILLVWVVIPGWIERPYFSVFNRWTHLGASPWEILASPVLRPAEFFSTVFNPERFGYLILLVVPFAGLPLLAPEILAVGLPPLASNLLSNLEVQYTIRGQYTAALTPILLAAAVVGGRRVAERLAGLAHPRAAVLAGLAAASVVAGFAFSPLPWSQDPFARKQFWDVAPRAGLPGMVARIPPEASVSAANHLGAHLAFRKTIKLFPEGADALDFVLVDVGGLDYVGPSPNSPAFRPILRRLVESRPLVAIEDGLALFGRGTPSPDAVARLVNLRPAPTMGSRPVGDLALIAASVTPIRTAPRGNLRASYTWVATTGGQGVPCIAEALVADGGQAMWETTRPLFHALLTGAQWPTGLVADDQVVTVIPETVSPGMYSWEVTTWHDAEGRGCLRVPPGVSRMAISDVHIRSW